MRSLHSSLRSKKALTYEGLVHQKRANDSPGLGHGRVHLCGLHAGPMTDPHRGRGAVPKLTGQPPPLSPVSEVRFTVGSSARESTGLERRRSWVQIPSPAFAPLLCMGGALCVAKAVIETVLDSAPACQEVTTG